MNFPQEPWCYYRLPKKKSHACLRLKKFHPPVHRTPTTTSRGFYLGVAADGAKRQYKWCRWHQDMLRNWESTPRNQCLPWEWIKDGWMNGWDKIAGSSCLLPSGKRSHSIIGFLRGGCPRGGGNWGTLRIPREDWGTWGNIRETPPLGPPPLTTL